MTTIRRGLLLVALTLAVVMTALGATAPAEASFADSAPVPTTTFATATVLAPGNVTGSLTCGNSTTKSTMGVTWTASTSARISGYLVTVYFSDGYTQTSQAAATATSWSTQITTYNVTAYAVQYSVTTQTNYGWTQESTRTGWFQC